MSVYGMRELIDGVRKVRADTIRIAEDIPESHYDFRPAPASRSVAETLAHIALYWSFDRIVHDEARLDSLDGFDFGAFVEKSRAEEERPRSKAEIVELLRVEGEQFVEWLEQLPERILGERVQMPGGGSQNRFGLLLVSKEHEIHHRAQLTVLERLLGVVPHSIRPLAGMAEPHEVGANG
jgi:uncharacterized damage-inducible protein DinB